jgi:hypothetical protein
MHRAAFLAALLAIFEADWENVEVNLIGFKL